MTDQTTIIGMQSLWWNILITHASDIENAESRLMKLEEAYNRAMARLTDPQRIAEKITETKTKRNHLIRFKETGQAIFSAQYGYNYNALNDICDMIGSDAEYIRRKFSELTPAQFTAFLKSCDPLRKGSGPYHKRDKEIRRQVKAGRQR